MGQRERNKAAKRARIAAAARTLFQENGFEGTTIRAIAGRAGVGVGTVPLHFTSKADLLVGLFVDDLEAVVARQTASLPDGPLREQLLHLFAGFLETYAATFAQGPQAQRYDEVSQGFVGTLAQVIERHAAELRPEVDPGVLAVTAFSLYLVHVALFLRLPAPAVEPALEALGVLLDGLLAPLRR